MEEEVYEAKDRGARERLQQEEEGARAEVEGENDRAITVLAARSIAAVALVRVTTTTCAKMLEGRRCGKRPAERCNQCGVVLCEEHRHGQDRCEEEQHGEHQQRGGRGSGERRARARGVRKGRSMWMR